MSGDKNKKVKKVTKSTFSNTDTTSAQNVMSVLPEIDDVIKQAFLRFYDTATLKQTKLKDLEHLSKICEEFLSAYVILGYDLNGEKVHIMHASNHHDRDALVEHIRSTLISMVNP
jgi:hypothetical protein